MTAWRWWIVAAALVAAASGAPAGAAPSDDTGPPGEDLDSYPLADGTYQAGSFGWTFFTTPDGRSCGMAPNGGPMGCDAVPGDAPPGTNQTFVDATQAATYRYSNSPMFTRSYPVLPRGQRVQTLGAACAVDDAGAVHCQTQGNHGFILAADTGVLW